MKKTIITIIGTTIILITSACTPQKNQIKIPFEQAYTTFISYYLPSFDSGQYTTLKKGSWKSNTFLRINSNTPGFKLQISTTWQTNKDTLTHSGITHINGNLMMNGEPKKIDTTVKIFQNSLGNETKQYINIASLDCFLWSGNIQTQFIKQLTQPLIGNWIEIDTPTPQLINNTTRQNETLLTKRIALWTILQKQQLLQNKGETSYQWYHAYQINIDSKDIEKIMQTLFSETKINVKPLGEIKWLLIIKDSDDIELMLTSIHWDNGKTITFTKNAIHFSYITEQWTKYTGTITGSVKKGYTITFTLEKEGETDQETVHIKGEITIKLDITNEYTHNTLNGKITISADTLQQIRKKDTIHITIMIDSQEKKTDTTKLQAPLSAMLLSQLLSDNFWLPYLERKTHQDTAY